MHFDENIWLCFSGGNAIGTYHAGAYEALAENGIEPKAIAGASIGAITAALIAGNLAGERVNRLRQFWSLAEQHSLLPDAKQSRIAGGMQTLMSGRPGLFHPRIDWSIFGMPSRASLFDPAPMRRELQALIDFDQLNSGTIRLVVTAVDVETGELRSFDTLREQLTVDHLMASTAFPVFFPPVRLNDKHYVDPGVVCNLPIEPLFVDMPAHPVTCFAFDAAIPHGPVPHGVDAALIRAQDILFSAQSSYALARIRQMLETSPDQDGSTRSLIRHVTFQDEANMETGLKMIDFRSDSLQQRWAEGKRTVLNCLGRGSVENDQIERRVISQTPV